MTKAAQLAIQAAGPAFAAYPSTSQTVGGSVTTKLQVDTEFFDTASCFNNTGSTVNGIPAYAFKPNVAGYYQIQGSATFPINASTAGVGAVLYKNASQYLWAGCAGNVFLYPTATVATLIYLNGSTDYVELYIYNGTGGSATTSAGAPSYSQFSGALVRAA